MNPNVVQFCRPMPVVNAACCSDPRTMCERCAAAALRANRGESSPEIPEDFDLLGLPNTMEVVVNERRRELTGNFDGIPVFGVDRTTLASKQEEMDYEVTKENLRRAGLSWQPPTDDVLDIPAPIEMIAEQRRAAMSARGRGGRPVSNDFYPSAEYGSMPPIYLAPPEGQGRVVLPVESFVDDEDLLVPPRLEDFAREEGIRMAREQARENQRRMGLIDNCGPDDDADFLDLPRIDWR